MLILSPNPQPLGKIKTEAGNGMGLLTITEGYGVTVVHQDSYLGLLGTFSEVESQCAKVDSTHLLLGLYRAV